MKNILKSFLLITAAAFIFAACTKTDKLPFYTKGSAPVLSTDVTAISSAAQDSNKVVLNLSWTNPTYATDSSSQKFVIEIDTAGGSFLTPASVTVYGALSTTFTARQMDSIFANFGFTPGSEHSIDVRLKSSYSNNNEQYISNVVTIKVTPYIIPITLTVSPTTPQVLTIAEASNTALSFNWTASGYGNKTIYYALQLDTAGGNFSNPQIIKYGSGVTSSAITVADLNTLAILAGVAAGTTKDVEFRVVGYLDADYTQAAAPSNAVIISITTYLPFLYMYAPGDYQGWDPGTAPAMAATVPNVNSFEGYVNVPAGGTYEFKITSAPDWSHTIYGDGGGGTLSTSGGNLVWPNGAGYYLLKVDLTALTWSATITNWGIIGDATPGGWDNSTSMSYDAASKVWIINSVALNAGSMKFRANNAWDLNLGGDMNNLTYNGDNISVAESGNYKIELDLSHPLKYTATITKL